MPRILDRYLLREHLKTLLTCLLAFCLLEVLFDLFDRFSTFLQARLGAGLIVRYYACMLTPTLEYIMPAALLLATLHTLWQLTRHGEMTAMRASGISLFRIVLPFLAVGLTATAAMAVIKEAIAPRAGLWAQEFADNKFQELAQRVVTDHVYYDGGARRQWRIGEFDVKRPEVLRNVVVTQERPDGTPERKLTAGRAEWMDGQWWLYDALEQDYTAEGNPRGRPAPIPGSALGVPAYALRERPSDFVAEITPWEHLSARDMRQFVRSRPHLSRGARAAKLTDYHHRLALPWACLIVTLFGIPAGAKNARESVLGGILTTLLCFFAFYALMQVGIFLGKTQLASPWVAGWMTNAVFGAAGIVMLIRLR